MKAPIVIFTMAVLGGHETMLAYDGCDALKQVQENQPEVVILDIGMPGMTGYEVARAIRKTPGFESAVLVALTGWGAKMIRSGRKKQDLTII